MKEWPTVHFAVCWSCRVSLIAEMCFFISWRFETCVCQESLSGVCWCNSNNSWYQMQQRTGGCVMTVTDDAMNEKCHPVKEKLSLWVVNNVTGNIVLFATLNPVCLALRTERKKTVIYRLLRAACCLHLQGDRPDEGGSKLFWKVDKLLLDYTVQ
jgi:hypothetical protein